MTIKNRDGNRYSYEIKPEVEILAPVNNTWDFLINVENWWVKSNPDHKSLTINNSEREIRPGTKITIREKIAGIPCKAIGEITKYEINRKVEWSAVYYIFGLKWIRVNAGVAWKLRSISEDSCALMAHVWARFPQNPLNKFIWYFFKNIMNGIEKDHEHAMKELTYIKEVIEDSDIRGHNSS
jgi:hypothetical protein